MSVRIRLRVPNSGLMIEIKKESDLCDLFMACFNKLDGWVCYPEAAGFDILAVHTDGRQIGIEAKLALNSKVADQIIPEPYYDRYEKPGPDHRMVIVSKITDASKGIAKMLEALGVSVLCVSRDGTFPFYRHSELTGGRPYYECFMFDWNPVERCQVPVMVTSLKAGIPAPVRLTPWKESALKVIALLRKQGHITGKQISAFGIGVTTWTQAAGSKRSWLAKGEVRGQWVETEYLPKFDEQHPEVYALAVKELG